MRRTRSSPNNPAIGAKRSALALGVTLRSLMPPQQPIRWLPEAPGRRKLVWEGAIKVGPPQGTFLKALPTPPLPRMTARFRIAY
jgi:hypothetical protein